MNLHWIDWQRSQAYSCSAMSPHEAKMAGVFGQFRGCGFTYAIMLMPLIGYMIMNNPDFASQAQQVTDLISRIGNAQVGDHMMVPMTMSVFLPVGLAPFLYAFRRAYNNRLGLGTFRQGLGTLPLLHILVQYQFVYYRQRLAFNRRHARFETSDKGLAY